VFDYRQAVITERWYMKVRGGRRLQRFLMQFREMVERYLRDEKERRRIAEASQKRAYSDHTLEKRVRKLLEIVREA